MASLLELPDGVLELALSLVPQKDLTTVVPLVCKKLRDITCTSLGLWTTVRWALDRCPSWKARLQSFVRWVQTSAARRRRVPGRVSGRGATPARRRRAAALQVAGGPCGGRAAPLAAPGPAGDRGGTRGWMAAGAGGAGGRGPHAATAGAVLAGADGGGRLAGGPAAAHCRIPGRSGAPGAAGAGSGRVGQAGGGRVGQARVVPAARAFFCQCKSGNAP